MPKLGAKVGGSGSGVHTGFLKLTGGTLTGQLIVPDGTAAAPGVRTTTDASGIYLVSAGVLGVSAAGVHQAQFTGTHFYPTGGVYAGGSVQAAATFFVGWGGGRAKMTSSADGKVIVRNTGDTAGFLLDGTTDGTCSFRNRGDSAYANVWGNGFYIGSASVFFSGAQLALGTGNSTLYATTAGATLSILTNTATGTAASGAVSLCSGNQTNAGDYASGNVLVYSGATTTDGDSGDIRIYSGAAGAGTADAGDIVFAVNGAPGTGTTALTIAGNGGGSTFGATVTVPDGSVSAPGVRFATDPTGFWRITATSIGVGFNGVSSGYLSSVEDYRPALLTASTVKSGACLLTSGTMTKSDVNGAYCNVVVSKFSWTNTMVTNLGAVSAGNIKVCSIPPNTAVIRAWVIISTAESHLSAMTVTLGRVGTGYVDYMEAADAKAAANTIHNAIKLAETTASDGGDLISMTAATDVYCRFATSDGSHTLADALDSTGVVYIQTVTLP